MEFRFSAEDEAFRGEVVQFLETELPPGWADMSEGPAEEGAANEERWQFTRYVPALARRARLADAGLADRARRRRRRPRAPGDVQRGDGALPRPRLQPGRRPRRADDHHVRLGRAQRLLPAGDSQRGDHLVPGLQRARLGLRPRLVADARAARRRRLHHQRPENLDLRRAARRLDLLPRAHRARRAQASRHLVLPDRHEDARDHRAPAGQHGQPPPLQRGLLRGRAGAGVEHGRRGESRLVRRHDHARLRALRHLARRQRRATARRADRPGVEAGSRWSPARRGRSGAQQAGRPADRVHGRPLARVSGGLDAVAGTWCRIRKPR